jgi:hypothetical protein
LFLGCFYLLSSAINPFLYSLFSKRFRRGFYDLIYKGKSCNYGAPTERPGKPAGNNQNVDNPENILARYNSNNDMVVIMNIRGGYNGKQIITRKALRRHFNVEVSSTNLGDCVTEDNRGIHKKKHNRVNISKCPNFMTINPCVTKDSVILSPTYEAYSCGGNSSRFQSRQKSRTRRYFNKSEGDSANTGPLLRTPRSLIHNESELNPTETRRSILSSSDRKRSCKYKVVFSNPTTSDISSNAQPSSHGSIINESSRKKDLIYIDGSTYT